MLKNCLTRISIDEYQKLISCVYDDGEFLKCKTEYKKYLKTLDRRALENEWSQNLDMLSDLTYSYEYFKSYYFVNVYNYAKYIDKDSQYIQLDEWVISVNANENLRTINDYLYNLCDYMKKYMDYIRKFKSKYPTRAFIGKNKTELFEETHSVAYECFELYCQLEYLYNILDDQYWINMTHLDKDKIPTKIRKKLKTYPAVIIGKDACDRISYFANNDSIFESIGR